VIVLFVPENLQRYFSRYGEVIDCVVMKNSESGRSRGFGFVTFSDPANVSLVLQNGPHQLDGRTVKYRLCGSHINVISILIKYFISDVREGLDI
jgi:RNA-binding protein Musashi